jgi:hypothetical protein
MAALLMTVAALLWAGYTVNADGVGTISEAATAKATALHKRYADFEARCIAAGMPKGHYGLERSGDVVAAGSMTGNGYTLFIAGKAVATDTSRAVILERYYTARDSSNGGRTNAEYVAHNAQCTAAKAAAREASMTANGVALTKGVYRVAHVAGMTAAATQAAASGKGGTARKGKGKGKGKPAA